MVTRHIKIFELIVNWFLNLLDRNVIEMEIKREKVQMKPPKELEMHLVIQRSLTEIKGEEWRLYLMRNGFSILCSIVGWVMEFLSPGY